jgi:uncharacterized protein YggE
VTVLQLRPGTLAGALAITLAWSGVTAAQPVPEQDVLTVQGSGIVELAPDIADVLIGVRTEEPTAAGALDTNSAATGRVVADAKRLGIGDRDIQTSLLQLSGSERDDRGRRIKIYQATNTVTVRVRDLPKLGAVIRELVDSGANAIQGVRFSLANPQPHFDQARRQAVEDARRRATILAEAAGRRLGPVVTLAETTWNDPGVVTMARAAAPRSEVPVEAGQIGVRAGVAIKWRLEP